MRWMVAALLCVGTLALSGCAGGEKADAEPSATASATTAPTVAPNQPPVGTLTAVVNGTAVAFLINGTDPDQDNLTWELAFGDGESTNGTSLPANATHDYATAGLFNATLTLDDGTAQATYNATVNATAEAVAGGTSVVFTGHVVAPSPSYNTEGECLEAIFTEEFGTIFDVPDTTWGWAYAFDVDGMTAIFYSEGLAENLQEGPSGLVPEGAVQVIACSQLAIDTDFALTLAPAAASA